MNLRITKQDQVFIKNNEQQLKEMYGRWLDGLRNDAFDLPAGEQRDNTISAIKFVKTLHQGVEVINKQPDKKEINKDVI